MIVTYNQAEKLKKLGFDGKVYYAYSYHEGTGNTQLISDFGFFNYNKNQDNKFNTYYSAPSVSEALQWIREKYEVYCGIYPFMWRYKGLAIIQDKYNPCTVEVEPLETHPLAETALLDAVLTYLEGKKK